MHRAKAFLCVLLSAAGLAMTGFGAVPVLAMDHPAAACSAQSYGVVIMAEGDVYRSWIEGGSTCAFPPHPWVLVGNVFASAGRGAPGPVVGMNQNFQILAANGDWFQGNGQFGGGDANFLGNVFDMTGVRVPGEEFVTFGGGPGTSNEYAATNLGNVYRWDFCSAGSAWSYIGAIPGNIPVSTSQTTWGKLKLVYR